MFGEISIFDKKKNIGNLCNSLLYYLCCFLSFVLLFIFVSSVLIQSRENSDASRNIVINFIYKFSIKYSSVFEMNKTHINPFKIHTHPFKITVLTYPTDIHFIDFRTLLHTNTTQSIPAKNNKFCFIPQIKNSKPNRFPSSRQRIRIGNLSFCHCIENLEAGS